jgi:hypothetical protein
MSRVQFDDGSVLEYARGSFDNWCVYLERPGIERKPPKDVDYFNQLKSLKDKHGKERVYADFVEIYEKTTRDFEESIIESIRNLSERYPDEIIDVQILFVTLYMAMVAEENKRFTKLGKKIKRLGVHQIINLDYDSHQAANFSKGMPWREIQSICEKNGF